MSSEGKVILEAKGAKKSFLTPGQETIKVLKGVDFILKEGESLSIRGESGAGKTTLLNLITLLERPDEGEILWDGKAIQGRSNSWLAKRRGGHFGLVFQAYYLLPELNAFDNVLMAKRLIGRISNVDRKRARSLLEEVGLQDRWSHLPWQLSGGESQRVAIARALMNKPQLLIADEPTGSLDEKTGLAVMDLLLNLCKTENTGLILVTHNPEFAKQTQRQGILIHGKLETN